MAPQPPPVAWPAQRGGRGSSVVQGFFPGHRASIAAHHQAPGVLQRSPAGSALQLPGLRPQTPGQRLPSTVQQNLEGLFRTDFSDVRIHVGSQAASLGALALTHGSDIYFAPGHYAPGSPAGLRLLGHELTHVVQQRSGRVRNPFGAGLALVQDMALEAEAERMGLRTATLFQVPHSQGSVQASPVVRPGAALPVHRPSAPAPRPARPATTVQAFFGIEDEKIYTKPLLPPTKQRQKINLPGMLKAMPKNLQTALSKSKLKELGLNELQAMEVLATISAMAGSDKDEGTFASWPHLVSEVAGKLKGPQKEKQHTTTETTREEETKIEEPGLQLKQFLKTPCLQSILNTKVNEDSYELLFEQYLILADVYNTIVGKSIFTCEKFADLFNLKISIHGKDSKIGTQLTLHVHLVPGVKLIYQSRKDIDRAFQNCCKLASIVNLDPLDFLDAMIARVLEGSVRQGKICSSARDIEQICLILEDLIKIDRMTKKAWKSIHDQIIKMFWGMEAKNQTKMCRELGSALQILKANAELVLSCYEKHWGLEDDFEFDLLFVDTTKEEKKKYVVEIESEKEGAKTAWDEVAASYYAKRWARKLKNFQTLGKQHRILFLISDDNVQSTFIEKIKELALREKGVKLDIVSRSTQFA